MCIFGSITTNQNPRYNPICDIIPLHLRSYKISNIFSYFENLSKVKVRLIIVHKWIKGSKKFINPIIYLIYVDSFKVMGSISWLRKNIKSILFMYVFYVCSFSHYSGFSWPTFTILHEHKGEAFHFQNMYNLLQKT